MSMLSGLSNKDALGMAQAMGTPAQKADITKFLKEVGGNEEAAGALVRNDKVQDLFTKFDALPDSAGKTQLHNQLIEKIKQDPGFIDRLEKQLTPELTGKIVDAAKNNSEGLNKVMPQILEKPENLATVMQNVPAAQSPAPAAVQQTPTPPALQQSAPELSEQAQDVLRNANDDLYAQLQKNGQTEQAQALVGEGNTLTDRINAIEDPVTKAGIISAINATPEAVVNNMTGNLAKHPEMLKDENRQMIGGSFVMEIATPKTEAPQKEVKPEQTPAAPQLDKNALAILAQTDKDIAQKLPAQANAIQEQGLAARINNLQPPEIKNQVIEAVNRHPEKIAQMMEDSIVRDPSLLGKGTEGMLVKKSIPSSLLQEKPAAEQKTEAGNDTPEAILGGFMKDENFQKIMEKVKATNPDGTLKYPELNQTVDRMMKGDGSGKVSAETASAMKTLQEVYKDNPHLFEYMNAVFEKDPQWMASNLQSTLENPTSEKINQFKKGLLGEISKDPELSGKVVKNTFTDWIDKNISPNSSLSGVGSWLKNLANNPVFNKILTFFAPMLVGIMQNHTKLEESVQKPENTSGVSNSNMDNLKNALKNINAKDGNYTDAEGINHKLQKNDKGDFVDTTQQQPTANPLDQIKSGIQTASDVVGAVRSGGGIQNVVQNLLKIVTPTPSNG
jgi:hypothetical protein